IGQGHMGKTHLLSKVFPRIARQKYHSRCIALDMRNKTHTIPNILRMASSQLDDSFLHKYLAFEKQWIREHNVIKVPIEDTQLRDFYLTSHFVKELNTYNDACLCFFFDTVDEAKMKTQ